jgi:hypothetical protein
VGTLLIVVGLATGALGFLDAFLSEAQKHSLNNWMIKTWYVINVMKENGSPARIGEVLFITPVKRLAEFFDSGIHVALLNIVIMLIIVYVVQPSLHHLYQIWIFSMALVPALLFGPFLFTFILGLSFSFVELFIRRIAESPKGVIAALAAIITGAGAILKAL